MVNKCPNSYCDFIYKVKKKPFKCDLCLAYIGTIYHYRKRLGHNFKNVNNVHEPTDMVMHRAAQGS